MLTPQKERFLFLVACRLLVPQPEIKPVHPLWWKCKVLTTGLPGKSQDQEEFKEIFKKLLWHHRKTNEKHIEFTFLAIFWIRMDQFGTCFQTARVVLSLMYVCVCLCTYIYHVSPLGSLFSTLAPHENLGAFLKKNLGPRALTLVEPRFQLAPVLESAQADSSSSIKKAKWLKGPLVGFCFPGTFW